FAVVFSPTRDYEIVVVWVIAPPVNIAFTFLSIYYIIPNLRKSGKKFGRYFWGNVALTAMICLLLLLLLIGFMRNGPAIPIALILTSICMICIATPFAWYIYKNKFEKQTEIQMLKTELGKSDASLNFLKSQI
ncbi:hypothetical protein, partial [Pseudomonas viridiflava]